jgi:hypothetical protein
MFQDSSSAGSAAITNNRGDSLISFADTSTAGSASITINGGALTQFTRNGTGGSAQFLTDAGGRVDFSGTTGAAGNNQVTAGSIAPIASFTVGAKPAADLGVVTAAAEIQMMSGWALTGKFDGDLASARRFMWAQRARYAW